MSSRVPLKTSQTVNFLKQFGLMLQDIVCVCVALCGRGCVCVWEGGRGGGGGQGGCVCVSGGTVLFFMFVCAYVCAPSNIVRLFGACMCGVGWGCVEGRVVCVGGGGLCGKEGRAVSVGRGRAVCDGGGGGCVCGGRAVYVAVCVGRAVGGGGGSCV